MWYHTMCVVEIICTHTHTHTHTHIYIYIYIYLSYTYTMCNTIQEYGFCSCNYRSINIFMLLYLTLILNQVKHYIVYLFNSTK